MLTFGLGRPARNVDYGVADGWIWQGQQALVALDALPIKGLHNAANVMAALALCAGIDLPADQLLPGLARFRGLPHRVETVAEKAGVRYVDDSKGTNVGATLAAIEGLGCKVAIVLGGDGKGQDFSPLQPALAAHGRAVALIGRDAEVIATAIAGCGLPQSRHADMDSAVRWLAAQAQAGDCVLLSPACASLDMYRNYAHRAEAFITAVEGLPA
jgi:UDP-N-acetylmuramoylalanine--D-glutamate ligase